MELSFGEWAKFIFWKKTPWSQFNEVEPSACVKARSPYFHFLEAVIPVLATSEERHLRLFQEQIRSEKRLWMLLAGFLLLPLVIACIRWMLDHPYGIHWDEALYFNNVLRDLHNLYSGSLRQLGSIIIGGDIRRPPANLLLALPFLAVFGFHAALARVVTLSCWGISGWFIYKTTSRIGSPAAATLAALVFCLSPEVISASVFFSTEGPFFIATSAMLYFASFYWSDEAQHSRVWIGLGLSSGMGLLSKSSFLLIAVPILAVTVVLFLRRNYWRFRSLSSFVKACSLAFVVAAPWWIKNLDTALEYTRFAREQPRNSLGAPSFSTSAKWLFTVVVSLIGPALSILIGIVAIVAVWKIILKKEICITPVHCAALVSSGAALFPLVVLQLSGTNHLLRYLCPAVIPFAVAVGVVSEMTGWIHCSSAMAISGTLAAAQVLMLVTPVAFPNHQPVDPGLYNGAYPWRILVRFEQWDLKPLRDISQGCGLEKPKIAFLGMGRPLNPPQILYPWFLAGTFRSDKDFPEPLWLWRYEHGLFDWQSVITAAEKNDIVLTARKVCWTSYRQREFG